MSIADINSVIENLEINLRWIEDNENHQFPGWLNVTIAMRDAIELLEEYRLREELK